MGPAGVTRQELVEEAEKLLASLDGGSMSATAYDTAWVARLASPANPEELLFPASFDWLLRHQRADGSWGAEIPFAHDRVISTMAALVALAGTGYRRAEAEVAVRRGVVYLNRDRANLRDDPAETVGFELLLPELMRQAQALGLRLPYEDWTFVEAIKADKLRRIPPVVIYGGPTSLTHSLEYLGDRLAPMLIHRCQSPNGSFGSSPSATAYVQMHAPSAEGLRYLDGVARLAADGGVVDVFPINVFETAWVLRALSCMKEHVPLYGSCVQRLAGYWTSQGVSFSDIGMVSDADDTAVSLAVLRSHGEAVETDVLQLFEGDEHFYCFPFERDQSVSANAAVLEALRLYDSTPDRRRMTLKLIHYLAKSRVEGRYWRDKWHASPFYATARAVSALVGLDHLLTRPAVQWVLEQQHENGAWGFGEGTAEETAYALETLLVARSADAGVSRITVPAVVRGSVYLADHLRQESYPRLWLGKGNYAPHRVVRAAIVGALFRSQAAAPVSR